MRIHFLQTIFMFRSQQFFFSDYNTLKKYFQQKTFSTNTTLVITATVYILLIIYKYIVFYTNSMPLNNLPNFLNTIKTTKSISQSGYKNQY